MGFSTPSTRSLHHGTTTGSMTAPRYFHTATLLLSGKVLAAGGDFNSGSPTNSAELYDSASGTWTSTGPMTFARALHTATLLPSGKVLAVAGYNAGYDFFTELYDPVAQTWSIAGTLQ